MSDQYMLDALLGSSDRSELDNALASAYSPSMEISPHANPLSSYNFSSTNDPAGSSSDGAGHSRDFSSSSSSSLTRTPATTPTGRKRPRHNINLAPDQPPTARGNPRVRVFVACFQWLAYPHFTHSSIRIAHCSLFVAVRARRAAMAQSLFAAIARNVLRRRSNAAMTPVRSGAAG